MVLLLIGVSATFQYLIGLYQVADLTGELRWRRSRPNPWVIFFLINLILFVLGTFMDMASDDPDLHADLPADRACSTAWTRCSSAW